MAIIAIVGNVTAHTFSASVPVDSIGTEAFSLTIRNDGASATVTPYLVDRNFSMDLSPITLGASATNTYTIYANPHLFGTNTADLYFIPSSGNISAKVALTCTGTTATTCLTFNTPDTTNLPIADPILLSTAYVSGVNQSSLNVFVNNTQIIKFGAFTGGWTGAITYTANNFNISILAPALGWGYNQYLYFTAYIITKDKLKGVTYKTYKTHALPAQLWDTQIDFTGNITGNPATDYTTTVGSDGTLIPSLSTTYWRAKFDLAHPKVLRQVQVDMLVYNAAATYTAKIRGASNVAALAAASWSGYLPVVMVGTTLILDVSSLYLLCGAYEVHIELLLSTTQIIAEDFELPDSAQYSSIFSDSYSLSIATYNAVVAEEWNGDITPPTYSALVAEHWEIGYIAPTVITYSALLAEPWEVGYVAPPPPVTYSILLTETWET